MINMNQNVFIYQEDKLIQSKHNTFLSDGITLIYNMMGNKENVGIKYIEFWNGSVLQDRSKLISQQFNIDNNQLQLSYQIPVQIQFDFDRIELYGGSLQTDNVSTGLNIAEVKFDTINSKLPYSIETIIWEFIINIV